MTQGEPKNHHTTPRFYLASWEKEGKLFVYDLKKELSHENTAAKIFKKKNFYTLDGPPEEKTVIERYFSDCVEYETDQVIEKLISSKPITPPERVAMARFLAAQRVRTPKTMSDYVDLITETSKEALYKSLETEAGRKRIIQAVKATDVPEEIIKKLEADPMKFYKEILAENMLVLKNKKEVWFPEMLRHLEDLAPVYAAGDWFVIRSRGKHSFVTSDNPIVPLTFKNERDEIVDVETTLPLNPKTCLLIRKNGSGRLGYGEPDGEYIKEINLRTVMYSDRYIVAHEERLAISVGSKHRGNWLERKARDPEHMKERARKGVAGAPESSQIPTYEVHSFTYKTFLQKA